MECCPEKTFASSSRTISSILFLSVANLHCTSLAAVNIPFFLTVLLTSLQNCLEVKVALECSLLWRRLCWTLSVICILSFCLLFKETYKLLVVFSIFIGSKTKDGFLKFQLFHLWLCNYTLLSKSAHGLAHNHISPIQWFSCTQSLLLPLMFLEETFTFLQCPWDSNLPIPHKLQRLLFMPPQCRFYRETTFCYLSHLLNSHFLLPSSPMKIWDKSVKRYLNCDLTNTQPETTLYI